MYKWVDEKGVTHYGDSIPPQYAPKATVTGKKSAGSAVKQDSSPKPVDAQPVESDPAMKKALAKQQVDRQRQDMALLATYSSEAEIDQARERELKRHQDTMKMASAGLAKSQAADDKKKLDSLLAQSQQETDAINAKFDAQKTRYRELTSSPVAQANSNARPSKR